MDPLDDITAEVMEQISRSIDRAAPTKPVLRKKVRDLQKARERSPWTNFIGSVIEGLTCTTPIPRHEFIPRHNYVVSTKMKKVRDLSTYGIARTSYRHGVLKKIMDNVRDVVSCSSCGALPGEPCRTVSGGKIGTEKKYCHKPRVLQAKVAKGLAVT